MARRKSIEWHPAALVFPMMTKGELRELADDIAANGLREPIKLWNGVGLDGRNRFAACELAKITPTFETLPDDLDPVAYVLSVNVARRHMTKGALAMSVVEASNVSLLDSETLAELTGRYPVSTGRLELALMVKRYAADLVPAVIDGRLSLDKAQEIARQRREAASTDEGKLAQLDDHAPEFAAAVREERMTIDEAMAAWRMAQRVEMLPDDLAGRVRAGKLAIDEAEKSAKERHERIVVWAGHVRDALRTLARMSGSPIPDDLVAEMSHDELTVTKTVLAALEGGDYGFLG